MKDIYERVRVADIPKENMMEAYLSQPETGLDDWLIGGASTKLKPGNVCEVESYSLNESVAKKFHDFEYNEIQRAFANGIADNLQKRGCKQATVVANDVDSLFLWKSAGFKIKSGGNGKPMLMSRWF